MLPHLARGIAISKQMEESLLTLCAPITRGNKRHVFKDMKIVSREATVEGEPKKVFHIFR